MFNSKCCDFQAIPIDVAIAQAKEQHNLTGDRLELFKQRAAQLVARELSSIEIADEFGMTHPVFCLLVREFAECWDYRWTIDD